MTDAGRHLARARAAWGDDALPQWVTVLARACDASTLAKVGRRVGYGASTLSEVLGRSYRGRLEEVETAVYGALKGVTVACPILGALSTVDCRTHQGRRAQDITNELHRRLYRACRTCPNRRTGS